MSCSAGCLQLFQRYLSQCRLHLEAVPSLLRLELLENIFSLLFLSTTDFAPQSQSQKADCCSDAAESKAKTDDGEWSRKEKQKQRSAPATANCSHLDLGHLIQGCRGFLVDVTAMEGFLKLLKEELENLSVAGQQDGQQDGQEAGRALPWEAEAAEKLGCSVTAEMFDARLQRLSKRTAEAQWRLQIISSNQSSGNGEMDQPKTLSLAELI